MGKFKDLFTDLFGSFDININDQRELYKQLEQPKKILVTSKANRKGNYYLLHDKIMIFNLLREEPELMGSILEMALEDGFLVDMIYAKIELKGQKAKCCITHDINTIKDADVNEFEHILILKEDIDTEDTVIKTTTDSIRGRVTRVVKKIIDSYSKKPSNNLEFLSYRVKKLIEERKEFYKSVGDTKRSIFLRGTEDVKMMNEHEDILSGILNFKS